MSVTKSPIFLQSYRLHIAIDSVTKGEFPKKKSLAKNFCTVFTNQRSYQDFPHINSQTRK